MIIAGFPGVGKSTLTQKLNKLNIHDSDSSKFSWLSEGVRNPDFIKDYFEHIESILEDDPTAIVLTSTHAEVLKELDIRGHNFIVVIPDINQLDVYVERYKNRGSDGQFIANLKANWHDWITDIQTRYPEECRVLDADDNLTDYAIRAYEQHK